MKTSFIWGTIIIIIGVLLLFNNLGLGDFDLGYIISTYWPVVLIIWGLESLIEHNDRKNRLNMGIGLLILVLGIAIIARNLGYYTFDFSILWKLLWPLLLIYIGYNILKSETFSGSGSWAVMSGIERKQKGWELKDESYNALMGGIDLDLTAADIPEGETTLNMNVIMGGIDIKAPKELPIIFRGNCILGGISLFDEESGGILVNREFVNNGSEDTTKKLVINSLCIMGGIDIN
ncbi:MAG: LiaF transmembrane domain-containing protein [Halanaerobiales bacterium]